MLVWRQQKQNQVYHCDWFKQQDAGLQSTEYNNAAKSWQGKKEQFQTLLEKVIAEETKY